MADFLQAVRWMEEGVVVQRASRTDVKLQSGGISHVVKEATIESFPWRAITTHLLADDWELAEPAPQKAGSSMAEELQPCPFCGSPKIRAGYIRDGQTIYCVHCGARVHSFEPQAFEKAAKKWNTRAPQKAGK